MASAVHWIYFSANVYTTKHNMWYLRHHRGRAKFIYMETKQTIAASSLAYFLITPSRVGDMATNILSTRTTIENWYMHKLHSVSTDSSLRY